MKQVGNVKKKVGSLLLTAALIITSCPVSGTEVHAAENVLPDNTQFAEVADLMQFNTNDNDGTKNPAKVYFGNNNQQWWIAGSQQEKGLTLFAASSLANRIFEPSMTQEKTYDASWNCNYNGFNPTEVYPNHYGASLLRTDLRDLENSYFTNSEQDLMNSTMIYTNDTKNSRVYSLEEKLYLAYGDYSDDQYITVGTNGSDNNLQSLNNGLRIDKDYWGNSEFWLRAPGKSYKSAAQCVKPDESVSHNYVNLARALVPAFELNLSSVIFASAAPAATSTGNLTLQDTDGDGAFTLRYKSDTLGSALVSYDKSKVTLTNVPKNTYLVVQNSNEATVKQITNETEVSASNMGLDSFANCKVWLETTDTANRITYATLAEEEKEIVVNITADKSLNITSNNGVQKVAPKTAITDITVEVADGYYLPDDYENGIQGLNGLTIKNITQNSFTISGTPTRDVNITLPAATALPKADTPVVILKTTSTSITVTVANHKDDFGDIEYKWNDGNWGEDKNTLSDLEPDTTYKLAVRFTGKGIYQPSEEYSVEITTLKDGNTVIVIPTDLIATYEEGLKLSDIDLSGTGWTWVDGNTTLSAGTKSYPATFDTTSLESTHDFSGVDGYVEKTHKVTRDIQVEVKKADSQVNIITPSLDKVYDGNAVVDPEYTTSGSDGTVTITWKKNTGTTDTPKWEDLKSAPSSAGNYKVVVELAENDNYNSNREALEFVISKAQNTWTEELSITGWTYNEKVNVPNAKAKYGDATFIYSSEKNGTYTSEVPKNAGTWYVKAIVTGTENYTGLESVVSFEIKKADTTLTFEKDNIDKIYDKHTISEPEVKKTGSSNDVSFAWFVANGNDWTLLNNAPSDVGTYKVVASVTEDSNYNGTSVKKEFSISIADNEWTKALTIKDWTYGETAIAPNAAAKFGDVVYTYSNSKDGIYTSDMPVNAGTWYVKASVGGTENYTGLETVPIPFEIAKAIPTYEKITGLVLGQGQMLNTIELPKQFKWIDETITADELGIHTFKAVFTPEDTANYQTVEVEIEVKVVPTPIELNHVPTINANDQTITVGDKFEPLKDVTSTDKEDGDLTSQIKVIKNTVDTKKTGTYEVTYQVADSQGASVTKTIKVTVDAKSTLVNSDKNKQNNDKDNNNVETGDKNNLLLWEVLLIGSGIILLYILYCKKRKTNR